MAKVWFFSLVMLLSGMAFASDNDVFMDEGDGDFDSVPLVPDQKPVAPATKSAKPNPDAKPQELTPPEPPVAAQVPIDEPLEGAKPEPQKAPPKASRKAHKSAKAEPKPEPKSEAKERKSAKASAAGLYVKTKSACPMTREPASESEPMITVKAEKKIWVKEVDENWVMAFNKAGEPGYIHRDCVE